MSQYYYSGKSSCSQWERPIYWYIAHGDAGKAFQEFSALGIPSKVYIVPWYYDDTFDRCMERELPLSIGGLGKVHRSFPWIETGSECRSFLSIDNVRFSLSPLTRLSPSLLPLSTYLSPSPQTRPRFTKEGCIIWDHSDRDPAVWSLRLTGCLDGPGEGFLRRAMVCHESEMGKSLTQMFIQMVRVAGGSWVERISGWAVGKSTESVRISPCSADLICSKAGRLATGDSKSNGEESYRSSESPFIDGWAASLVVFNWGVKAKDAGNERGI